jgi:hypothetical protein
VYICASEASKASKASRVPSRIGRKSVRKSEWRLGLRASMSLVRLCGSSRRHTSCACHKLCQHSYFCTCKASLRGCDSDVALVGIPVAPLAHKSHKLHKLCQYTCFTGTEVQILTRTRVRRYRGLPLASLKKRIKSEIGLTRRCAPCSLTAAYSTAAPQVSVFVLLYQ